MGAWVGGWVHKGVSEGVRECMTWFGGLGVCSLVSKRGTSMSFSPCIFVRGFFSVGLRGGPRTW